MYSNNLSFELSVSTTLPTTTLVSTTTSTTESKKCDCSEMIPVGLSDGRIQNSQMTSNSIRVSTPGSTYTGPEEARLNNQPSASGSGAWEPKDEEGYIDIHFNKVENLKEIQTQGSPNSNKYAKRFFLFISKDGKRFEHAPILSVSIISQCEGLV